MDYASRTVMSVLYILYVNLVMVTCIMFYVDESIFTSVI